MDLFETIMFFDSRSMIGILFWINLFLALMIFAFATTTRITQQREAIIRAVLSRIGFSAAFLLQLLRGVVPDVVSVNIGISLLFFCFYLDAYLMLSFLLNEKEKHYITILRAILITGLAAYNAAVIFYPGEVFGSVISSLIILGIYGIPTVTFIAKRRSSRFMRIIGGFYILFLISIFQRIIIPFTEIALNEQQNAISESGFYLVLVIIGVCGVISTFLFIKESDDKELKAAMQAAEEASSAKTAFLANMSHEIRTPMNAIIGMSELLQTESLNERQSRYANDIKVSSEALLEIVNEILDISKVESGKLDLLPVHFDFRAMLNNIDSIFQYAAKNKGISFNTRIDDEVPQYLYGDDLRLRQILVNICGNAVKFTERGYVELRVYTGEDTVTFEVEDTGIGIPKEALGSIFDPFAQAMDSKIRNTAGTGLGLSISNHLAEMMGGSIDVVSQYGSGSVFTVTIPKTEGDGSLVTVEETSSVSFHAPDCKVLVVDDNEINLKVALGYLELFGITADTASSGARGVELIKQNYYDIVFMDYMMPDMDGIEAARKIFGTGSKYGYIKMIALTANAVAGAEQMFLDSGFDGFLSKPIELERLAEVLRKWIPEDKIIEGALTPGPTDASANPVGNGFIRSVSASDELITKIGAIELINTKAGMANFPDMPERYIETLELFCGSIIPECDKMARFLAEGNIHSFAVSIHGMKASLLTVGISSLSSDALELEMAAKSGDMQYCGEFYPEFSERMLQLHSELASVFESVSFADARNAGDAVPCKAGADPTFVADKVKAALAAADELDNDMGVEALEALLGFDYNPIVEQQIKSAIESMKNFDFENAREMLKQVEMLIR